MFRYSNLPGRTKPIPRAHAGGHMAEGLPAVWVPAHRDPHAHAEPYSAYSFSSPGVLGILAVRHSQRARPKSRPNIPSVRPIEIAISVSNEPRPRRPASSAQHLMVIEPRLGIVLIGVGAEARIRLEIGTGPLPNIPDHLPAPAWAISSGQGSNIQGAHIRPIQIRALRRRRFVPPR